MATQLSGISVTLPSVGVSLTPTTTQLAWGYQSESLLLGVTIPQASATSSSTAGPVVSAATWPGILIEGF